MSKNILAKTISNIHNEPIKLAIMIVFVFLLFIALFLLYKWYQLYSLKRYELHILQKIEILKRLPLRQRLLRLAEIANFNSELINNLVVWRTKYELLIERKLTKSIESTRRIIGLKNKKKKGKTLQEIKKVYNNMNNLERDCRRFLAEMEKYLEVEFLQRDYVLAHKKLFNALVKDTTKLQMNVKLNDDRVRDFQNSIVSMFGDFEEYLRIGDFVATNQVLSNLTISLTIFVEILDNIPQILTLITKVIPSKLDNLGQKYATLDKSDNSIETNYNYNDLIKYVDEHRVMIAKNIDNLQYKKAIKNTIEIINKIEDFDNIIEEHRRLVTTFKKYNEIIYDYLNRIDRSFNSVSRQIEALRSTSGLTKQEDTLFRSLLGMHRQLSYDANKLVLEVKAENLDYHYLNDKLLAILNLALNVQETIEDVYKIVTSRNATETEIRKTIHLLEVVLLQAEIRLNQIPYQFLIKKYQPIINSLRNESAKYKDVSIDTSKKEESLKLLEKVNKLKLEVLKLFEKIKNEILLEILAQEAIVYGQRYILNADPRFEEQINNAELAYQKGNYEDSLYIILKMLSTVKNQ